MKFIPHSYQWEAFNFAITRENAGIFLDPGLGKTSISYLLIKRLLLRKKFKAALIIAPLRPVYLVWPKEARKWDNFKDLSYGILHGPNKDAVLQEDHQVYIINPDGLAWLFDQLKGKRNWPFDILIVDESTKFKHTNTVRFGLLSKKLYKFKRRYLLTGSPASKSLTDLFGQMWVMDDGETFGKKKKVFEKTYTYKSGYMGKKKKLKPGADRRIHAKVAPKVIQKRAEDHLDMPLLPPPNDILITLPPDVMREYRRMEKDLVAKFEEGRVVAANAGVASSKCRQIASGSIYTNPDTKEFAVVHELKIEAAQDYVEELSGQPLIIAYEFKSELSMLLKAFGKDTPYIAGGMSMAKTVRVEDEWNRGLHDILLCQAETASLGLNLQGNCNHLLWYTLTHRYDDYDQLIRRIYRQGQKKKRVIVSRLLSQHTIDFAVVDTLAQKGKNQNDFFNAIQRYWRNENVPTSKSR